MNVGKYDMFQNKSKHQGPLLLTCINFNPSMDKLSQVQWSVRQTYLSIPKL